MKIRRKTQPLSRARSKKGREREKKKKLPRRIQAGRPPHNRRIQAVWQGRVYLGVSCVKLVGSGKDAEETHVAVHVAFCMRSGTP